MSTTATTQQTDETAALDHALQQAEIHTAQLAAGHPDPQAADAYRWVGERLRELRLDAATVGDLEP